MAPALRGCPPPPQPPTPPFRAALGRAGPNPCGPTEPTPSPCGMISGGPRWATRMRRATARLTPRGPPGAAAARCRCATSPAPHAFRSVSPARAATSPGGCATGPRQGRRPLRALCGPLRPMCPPVPLPPGPPLPDGAERTGEMAAGKRRRSQARPRPPASAWRVIGAGPPASAQTPSAAEQTPSAAVLANRLPLCLLIAARC